jgi:hypothetical protein
LELGSVFNDKNEAYSTSLCKNVKARLFGRYIVTVEVFIKDNPARGTTLTLRDYLDDG